MMQHNLLSLKSVIVAVPVILYTILVQTANGHLDNETATSHATVCADPVGSILAILDCIKAEDVKCAAAGYPPEGF